MKLWWWRFIILSKTAVFCLERGYEIIIIHYLLLEAVEVGMLERMGKKSRKII
jgi:hypothetical protein